MALARIITRFAEGSHALAQSLRARGFEVQTRSPEETTSGLADLEITLEECATEDALIRSARAPNGRDVCVFIAPGAISESLRPIRMVPLIPEAMTVAQAGFVVPPTPEVAATAISDLVTPDGPFENVPAMTNLPQAVTSPEAEVAVREPEPIFAAADAMEIQPEAVAELSPVTFESEAVIPREIGPLGALTSDAESEPEPVEETASHSEVIIAQEPEHISEWPICTSISAQEITVEEPRLTGFQEVASYEAAPEEAQSEPVQMVSPGQIVPDPTAGRSHRIPVERGSRADRLFWRFAPLAAILALAFVLLAISAHRFSPIPSGVAPYSGEVVQPVPFSGTKRNASVPAELKKLPTPSPTAKTPATTKAATPDVKPVVAKPLVSSPSESKLSESKVSLASSRQRVVVPKPRQHWVASSDADYVAKDTVVRYGSHSAAPRSHGGKARK